MPRRTTATVDPTTATIETTPETEAELRTSLVGTAVGADVGADVGAGVTITTVAEAPVAWIESPELPSSVLKAARNPLESALFK